MQIMKEAGKAWKPPPKLRVSEWADTRRQLSSESSAEPGQWITARAEYQRGIMDALNETDVETIVIMSSAQVGKALDVWTPIPTPSGWQLMGDLKVGDAVFNEAGSQCRVTFATPHQYDRDCYEIRFSDGSSIVADADHRWQVEEYGVGTSVKTTLEMLPSYKNGKRNVYAIPVCGALEVAESDLPIDPYVFGLWLGDGHSRSGRIYCHQDDSFEFSEQIRAAGYTADIQYGETCVAVRIDQKDHNYCARGHDKRVTGWSGRGCAECSRVRARNHGRRERGQDVDLLPEKVVNFHTVMRSMGFFSSGEKRIPQAYLRASMGQRISLLQGLMDTDGYIDKRGRCEFVTTSIGIAAKFGELLSSLGIKYTSSDKQPRTRHNGRIVEGKPATRFSFMVYEDKPVFRLNRKRSRLAGRAGRRTTETERRFIADISPVQSRPVRCIQVDSESHLFLAGEQMIPTHNTEIVNNLVGYHIDQDPAPMLLLQPTIEMAQAWSKDRLAPMIRDTDALSGKIQLNNRRNSANTLLHKSFVGGHITMAGANSPASLASRPIRIVLCDEVDRYPPSAGSEGDPVNLARKRTTTFYNRKILLTSTPTIKGVSRIELEFDQSDQRRFHVACPDCGEYQHLKWAQVQWAKGKPETAAYVCEHCGVLWNEGQRLGAIRRGEWRATAAFNGRAGFHLNELYSPWVPLQKVVRSFLEAQGNPELLKTWVNTSLGETWEDEGEIVDSTGLMERREDYKEAPESAVLLTAGIDVQGDRLEMEVVAWGDGEESWNVDYVVIPGDPARGEVWQGLDDALTKTYPHTSGSNLHITAACIDSGGHHTQIVYDYARRNANRRIFAVKGVGGAGRPIYSISRKTGSRKVDLYTLGVDDAKTLHYARLKIENEGPGFCHFPMERNDEYFAQLTAEKVVTKLRRGFPHKEWVKYRPRNEALDCRVYAIAALKILNPVWSAIERRLQPKKATETGPTAREKLTNRPTNRRAKNGYAKRWR